MQAKLPGIKLKRFEKWFWATFKHSWVDSSAATTVLAKKYMAGLTKDMSWSKTTEEFMEKVKPALLPPLAYASSLMYASLALEHMPQCRELPVPS